jgi:hypothetical protein
LKLFEQVQTPLPHTWSRCLMSYTLFCDYWLGRELVSNHKFLGKEDMEEGISLPNRVTAERTARCCFRRDPSVRILAGILVGILDLSLAKVIGRAWPVHGICHISGFEPIPERADTRESQYQREPIPERANTRESRYQREPIPEKC